MRTLLAAVVAFACGLALAQSPEEQLFAAIGE